MYRSEGPAMGGGAVMDAKRATGIETGRQAGVASEVHQLADAIGLLDQRINVLSERLGTVLLAGNPVGERDKGAPDAERCAVAEAVRQNRRRLEDCSELVQQLISRLDI